MWQARDSTIFGHPVTPISLWFEIMELPTLSPFKEDITPSLTVVRLILSLNDSVASLPVMGVEKRVAARGSKVETTLEGERGKRLRMA